MTTSLDPYTGCYCWDSVKMPAACLPAARGEVSLAVGRLSGMTPELAVLTPSSVEPGQDLAAAHAPLVLQPGDDLVPEVPDDAGVVSVCVW
jgi:hypothetical protein